MPSEEVAFLKIVPKTYSGYPTISLASSVDGRPNLVQIALEKQGANTLTLWTAANYSKFMAEVTKMNVEVEIYLRANGAAPGEADITGAPAGVIRADVRHPNVGM